MPFYLTNMDGCCSSSSKKSSGNTISSETAPPRCKDYNGPFGNGKNDAGGIQEYINFIGSTCSVAVSQGLCTEEHSNNAGGCYNTHGGKLCGDLLTQAGPGRDGGLGSTKIKNNK